MVTVAPLGSQTGRQPEWAGFTRRTDLVSHDGRLYLKLSMQR